MPLGIIAERNMVKRVCLKNLATSKIKAEEIMSSPANYDNVIRLY
jgi:hypothetical protein